MGLTSVNAYVAESLRGKGAPTQEFLLQMQSIVLLNENGTPRCLIGQRPNQDFIAKQWEEFYAANPRINANTFNGLRECDENDEFYARSILDTEEISYGAVIPPVPFFAKAMLIGFAVGGVGGCFLRALEPLWKHSGERGVVSLAKLLIAVPLLLPGLVAGPLVTYSLLGAEIGAAGFLVSLPGNGVGLLVCDKLIQTYKHGW